MVKFSKSKLAGGSSGTKLKHYIENCHLIHANRHWGKVFDSTKSRGKPRLFVH